MRQEIESARPLPHALIAPVDQPTILIWIVAIDTRFSYEESRWRILLRRIFTDRRRPV